MPTRTQLLDKIAAFLRRTGMTERRFGIEAVGDHRLVSRIRNGAGVTLTVIERAEQFMIERGAEGGTANGEAA
jgi:hypothetical protein